MRKISTILRKYKTRYTCDIFVTGKDNVIRIKCQIFLFQDLEPSCLIPSNWLTSLNIYLLFSNFVNFYFPLLSVYFFSFISSMKICHFMFKELLGTFGLKLIRADGTLQRKLGHLTKHNLSEGYWEICIMHNIYRSPALLRTLTD